ncbi:hypothetical protein ACC727_35360, partial [Rhizobium johnstonii]
PLPTQQQQPKTAGANSKLDKTWGQGHRTRDNVIMPYVNVGALNTRLPITRVTVGPGKDASLTRKSIEKFLSQRPFYSDVEVAVSSIPFRT